MPAHMAFHSLDLDRLPGNEEGKVEEIPAHLACLPLDLDRSWGLLDLSEEGWAEEMPTHMACLPLDLGSSWGLLGRDDEKGLEQLAQTACILLVWDKRRALLGEVEILGKTEAGV